MMDSLINKVASRFQGNQPHVHAVHNVAQQLIQSLPAAELYTVLRALYDANGLFDELSRLRYQQEGWAPALKGLYNPTFSVVEFYAHRTLRGELVVKTDNPKIVDPLAQIARWSNLDNFKTLFSRCTARDGDGFFQVVRPADRPRVYYQMLDAAHVVDFDEDNRGNVTWLRLEKIAADRNADGQLESYRHIEVWSKADGTYRRWRIQERGGLYAVNGELGRLPTPEAVIPLADMGINFVPIVHAKHTDLGDPRGRAAVMPAFDLILECCLLATRLHQLAFRHADVTQAIHSPGRDPTGRPTAPPKITGPKDEEGVVRMGGAGFLKLPPGWQLAQLVPDLPYAELLAILVDQITRVEELLPEAVAFKKLREMGEVSGRAARLLLGDTGDRVEDATSGAEAVIVRGGAMGLTIGQAARIPGFEDLGDFDAGDFHHSFQPRDVFPVSESEDAASELAKAQAFQTLITAGFPKGEALRRVYKYTDADVLMLLAAEAASIERQAPADELVGVQ